MVEFHRTVRNMFFMPSSAPVHLGTSSNCRTSSGRAQCSSWKLQVVERLHAAFGSFAYSSKLSNTFTPRSVALRPLSGLVPVTTRPDVIE
jgi:hypothetical protein